MSPTRRHDKQFLVALDFFSALSLILTQPKKIPLKIPLTVIRYPFYILSIKCNNRISSSSTQISKNRSAKLEPFRPSMHPHPPPQISTSFRFYLISCYRFSFMISTRSIPSKYKNKAYRTHSSSFDHHHEFSRIV